MYNSLSMNIQAIANLALQAAHRVQEELGESGKEIVTKNQFDETALRADIKAEEAILDVLREFNVPIRIISEEHGTIDIQNKPNYLGVLDGLDGSRVYKDNQNGRYGTMFSIYTNTDPNYKEYIYGGIIEHAKNTLYFALKDKGCFILQDGITKEIHCSTATKLDPVTTRLYAGLDYDEVFNTDILTSIFNKKFQNYSVEVMRSSATHFADLSQGKVDAVIEVTRKGNLEFGVAYPLIVEAGGIMVDINGTNLSTQKFLSFGQSKPLHIISAGTKSMATAIRKKMIS